MNKLAPTPISGDPVNGKEYFVYIADAYGEGKIKAVCRFYKAGCSKGQLKRRYRFLDNHGMPVYGVLKFEEFK